MRVRKREGRVPLLAVPHHQGAQRGPRDKVRRPCSIAAASQSSLKLLKAILEDVFLRRENEGARTKQRLVTRLENLKDQLTRVESAFLYDRSIDHETYTTQRDRLRGDITDVTAELELLFDGADDFQMLLNFAGWVLNDVATNWIDADVRGRRALQAVVSKWIVV